MNVLLVAATREELSCFLKETTDIQNNEIHDSIFPNVQILLSGIGTASTLFNLTKVLLGSTFDLVIDVGICGAFSKDLPLGAVVEVKQDSFADQWVETGNGCISWNEAGLAGNTVFPYVNGILHATYFFNSNKLQKVTGITSDTVHANPQTIDFLQNRYNPHVESMEGAAVFYVCAKTGIPCAQIRAVSNYVGTRDKSQWKIQLAVQNLAEVLKQIVETCQ